MKKDKLFHLFYTLTPKEVKAFKTFVIGRKPAKINSLVEFLAKHKPNEYNNFEKIKQKACTKLFPNKENNSQNFRRLIADTLPLLNDFLILQETKANPALRRELLQEQYKNRTLSDLLEAAFIENTKLLNENPERDFHHYDAKVKLLNESFFYTRYSKTYNEDRLIELIELQNDLDLGYVIAKLHYRIHQIIHHLVTGNPFDINSVQQKHEFFKLFEDHPVVHLFTEILRLALDPNEENYFQLKSLWLKRSHLLSQNLKLQYLGKMVNLAWFSLNQNIRIKEIFELYGYGIEAKLLLNSGYINNNVFNSIIDIGTSLKEFDKVRVFVKEYLPFLREGPDQKENVNNLYEAFLLFSEGKYEKAFLKSNLLQFSHHSYGLRSYVLIIKCLYETKKVDSYLEIEARGTAFRQYLQRKLKQADIVKELYDANVNFIKIASQLPLASSSKFAKVRPEELIKKTKAMQRIVSRPWLLEKLEELQ